ncbi:K02A2.6-like [Cordylochernes scorpioides]|uniref:K02A2.6-like n=1 Tax=Cordylochernes scorpioides TaxID=51811 RepID=A0ABY6K8Q2_9ARAC|nr:K02A2.6-like [Cordylochernes scorpioides]
MMLRTVTGDTAPIEGELDVDIRLGGTRFDHRVLVADIEDEFILGMDIIREHGFTFDPTQGILRLGDESFVLSTEGEKCEGVRLFACENGCVSGNCEGVIMTVAEAPLGSGVGLIEPTCDARQNLLVARAIVKTADKKVPVRLANVFPSGISIRKGDFLAVCSPISRIATAEGTNCQSKVNRVGQTKLEIDLKDLTEDEARMARAFIKKNQDAFSTGNGKLGRTDLVQHKIYTGNARPVRQPPRRVPMAKRDEVVGLLHKLKQDGVIEESNSPWSSPVVLVTKKDGSTRFCVDYRKLNEVTKKDSYPLPRIDDTLTTLAGSSWFSTLDLKSGYWQVGVHPADREKTAFSTRNGLYQFTVMPFGLCNAPATFERLMELVLRGLTWKTCLVYLDDVMVMGRTFGEHLKNLQEIFNRFKAANLGLNPGKCQLFQRKVEFLGHTVSAKGIQTSESKILAIRDWPKPKDKHELRSFLGLCTYYRRFVEGYADIAAPLHRLTEAKSAFHWSQDCENAFVTLKGGLCSSPVLVYPQPGMRFVLDTDASNSGIGAVLSQVQDGEERVIEYYSKILTKPERNYCATRGELLAIVRSVEHFHRIAIDVAGPFPVTEDGNKYLLVAMDYFTKWPEVYAIPNQEAATVARVLVDNLICRFGVPLELHSDQGRNFESGIFRELCQSDGMVERFNKTMVEHLSKVVEQNQRDWDRRLPLFLMAYRAAIHETTGQTPAKVMFGRELRLPCDLEFGTPGGPPVEVTSYVGELRGVLSETHKLVREKIQLASHRMKTHYDLKANHEGFKESDLVWMFNPKRKRGLSPKLTPMWEGPYKVVKRINDLVYRIQRSSKAKPRVVHLSRLAPFQGEQSEWT